eukprot:CAMPEP_0197863672 /NCGR_PEP_ID=MMETSP1438-20131217/41321_1 /TAXON_ID=1461541 /ORGANISM="Pterosperma sp., Strain CCMP1384" /LENGTH=207 /DNA_ID=CAMNT_0043481661 /DNA_START=57 /DNA_END=677 /DNA_ORIENTATION=+
MTTVGEHQLAEADVKGALFDVDGTLVDSMPNFFPSWNVAGEKWGLKMSEETFYLLAGKPLPDMVQYLHETQLGGPATDEFVKEFLALKKVAHVEHEKKVGTPAAIQPTVDIARAFKDKGIPICCATSGLREHVEEHLQAAGMGDLFPSHLIVCAADLPSGCGKPKPDIFMKAAQVIGVEPHECRAFEDAEAGLESAWRAGCHTIDVR